MKGFFRKIHKRIFERFIGRIFYQTEYNILKRGLISRVITFINQTFNEKGVCLPWIYTQQECLDFWQSINNNSLHIGNQPKIYAGSGEIRGL